MDSNEKWEFVKGTKDYLVSNRGRVLSLKKEPCILVQSTTWQGYKRVNIMGHQTSVHRLVAEAFVNGYFEGAIVNHIDENPANNNAENLEWCTYSKNNSYGKAHESRKVTKGAAIKCYNSDGELVGEFYSMAEAARVIGCSVSGISACLNRNNGNRLLNGLYWVKVKEANTHA